MLRNVTLLRSLAAGSLCLGLVPLTGACSSTVEGKGSGVQAGGTSSGGGDMGGSGGDSSSTGGSGAGGGTGGGAPSGGAASGGAGSGGSGTGGQVGPVGPSCEDVTASCGPNENDNCCASALLTPEAFFMGRATSGSDAYPNGNADETPERTATPVAVWLDKYEVTVGRFRKFIEAYPLNKPKPGDGAHPGQGASGWKAEWDGELPDTADDVIWDVSLGCGNMATWFDDPVEDSEYGNTETRPINCVSWYYAFAFCAWDGGFLPSEADWEFAAAGGSENRLYPWGGAAPNKDRAAFDCAYDGTSATCGWAVDFDPWTDIAHAGAISEGRGRFGHYELAGNLGEWVMDGYNGTYYATLPTCTNCINLTDTGTRVVRGGDFRSDAGGIRAAFRASMDPSRTADFSNGDIGFRCARGAQ
jgi:formylglycine-generating enzyme required for sulfatase activity